MTTCEFDEAIKKEMRKVKSVDCMTEYQEEALRTASKMSTIFLMQYVINDCEEIRILIRLHGCLKVRLGCPARLAKWLIF